METKPEAVSNIVPEPSQPPALVEVSPAVPPAKLEIDVAPCSRHPLVRLFNVLFRRHLPLEEETSKFILVNVLDFFMTYWMLRQPAAGARRFVEANRLARFFLERWNVRGLLGFKLGVVLLVCLLTQIIATQRPPLAEKVLKLGTLIVACVLVYSLWLLLTSTMGFDATPELDAD